MSKKNQKWNRLHERNINDCLTLVDKYDFEQFKLPEDIQNFIFELASYYKCDPKVFFYSALSGIGHFAACINVFNIENKQMKPISVYQILIAPSGMSRSFNNTIIIVTYF